jgi:putative flavoprotein involved in K+ transport
MQPASPREPLSHHRVLIVGAGQAGLSMSHCLQQRQIDHLLLEAATPMHVWRDQRWDAFSLVTPNWQCALPGHPYDGPDPHGFMTKPQILAYLDAFARKVAAPVRSGVRVTRVSAGVAAGGAGNGPESARERSAYTGVHAGFTVDTSEGLRTADQVVVASGGYREPIIPRFAERLPADLQQVQSADYRNAAQLAPGAVLVVGSGQSGAQIAEDLHLAGRKVFLATGEAPRCARFYRGRDVVDWLADMRYYDMPVEQHPLREGVRDNTNHYVTGRDGGRDIDLRRFASEGMELFGQLQDLAGPELVFAPNLRDHLDSADRTYNGINASIDQFIARQGLDAPPASTYQPVWQPTAERTRLDWRAAGIGSVVWCIGFKPDFGWLDAPVFNGRGQPQHRRGVTAVPGLYFLGLPWLHTWGSGRFSGVARDAHYLAECVAEHGAAQPVVTSAAQDADQPALA